MTISKHYLANRLSTEPLFLHPEFAATAERLLVQMGRLDIQGIEQSAIRSGTMLAEGKPYRVSAGGMAVIPVHGYLAHRIDYHYPGYFTGYGYISALLARAVADPAVKGIALDVNSHGGEVAGAFELADEILAAREIKPIWAIVDSNAHSAAMLLASAAHKIILPKTGSAGSIGVVTMHVDVSEALEKYGVKITMIYAGKHKVDGNPYQPLPESVKANIEARLEKSYTMLVDFIASARGKDPKVIRDTEAATFQGEAAMEAGLVDAIMPPRAAYAAFRRELAGPFTGNGGDGMSNELQQQQAGGNPADTEQQQANTVDVAAVQQAAINAERARISGITGSEEAKGRESLANHLAFNTNMSVDEARALLAVAPKADAPKAHVNAFEAAMNNSQNPEVGAGAGQDPDQDPDRAAQILGAYSLASGLKFQ